MRRPKKATPRSLGHHNRYMQRQARLGCAPEIGNTVIDDQFLQWLIDTIKNLEVKSRPCGGAKTIQDKDVRAQEVLICCGWLVQHLAGWALDHQRGLAIADLENVSPQIEQTSSFKRNKAAVDSHEHEKNGMSDQLPPNSPAVDRKILRNILRPLARFIDLPFWTVEGLKALDHGEAVPLFEKAGSKDKRLYREQLLQLKTIQFVEYEHAKGVGLSEARDTAGNAYGVSGSTVRQWGYRLRASLGESIVEKAVDNARLCGTAHMRQLQEPNYRGPGEFGEEHYGKEALEAAGKAYLSLLKEKIA